MTSPLPDPERSTADRWSDGSSLVGRDDERQKVQQLLGDHRLVTLTGPAGVGKTRLAMTIARGHAATTVCELLPVPDSSGVSTLVAEALGFPTLTAAALGLSGQHHLLVLDNTEHVAEPAAVAVDQLLRGTDGLRVLATGREPLGVPGEHLLVMDPLELPSDDDLESVASSPAVQLFVARAVAAGAPWGLDADTAPAIAAVCRRLDGLPLAIELAAARSRVLTPSEVLRHLDTRFDLLTRPPGANQRHHRSLEAAIAWSHERLAPPTREFFDRLGAFLGPFTLAAAHHVASDPEDELVTTIDRLDQLVARSMVVASVRRGGTVYELLESLRLYARARLADAGALEACDRRCVDHHVGMATELLLEGMQAWSDEVFQRLLDGQLNLQDALRWCLTEDEGPDRAYVLFVPLWGLVHNARAEVVADLGARLLERWDDPGHPLWPIVVATLATALVVCGDDAGGLRQAARVLERPDEDLGTVLAERARHLALSAREDPDGHAAIQRALRIAEAIQAGPYEVELGVFAALARVREEGDPAAAIAMLDAVAADQRSALEASSVLTVWWQLAAAAVTSLQDRASARATASNAVEVAARAGYPFGLGTGHRLVGALALRDGDLDVAAEHLARSLETFVAAGHLAEVSATLRWVAALAMEVGRPGEARDVMPSDALRPAILDLLDGDELARWLAGVEPHPGSATSAVTAARRLLDELRGDDLRGIRPSPRGAAASPEPAMGPAILREGDVWAVAWAGVTVRVADVKGMHDLASLLASPGREVAATELMGAGVSSGDLGDVLDGPARRAYEQRIIELQSELEEAEAFHDTARADTSRQELDAVVDQLAAATGLHGRGRRVGREAERARSAVTWRIRAAIGRIVDLHPDLGAHLQGSVRTGTWCAYVPSEAVTWTVRRGALGLDPDTPEADGLVVS